MIDPAHRITAFVHEHLAGQGLPMQRAGVGHWLLGVTNHHTTLISARLLTDWLVLETAAQHPLGEDAGWQFLDANRRLGDGIKFVLTPTEQQLSLRGELPLEPRDDTDGDRFARDIRAFWDRFEAARQSFSHAATNAETSFDASTPQPLNRAEEGVPNCVTLCEAAGWSATARSGKTAVVPLDVPQGHFQAVLEQEDDGALRTAVELSPIGTLSAACRQSVGRLMLTASGVVRYARAFSGQDQVGFEVLLGRIPTAARLAAGLSALSVACRLCGQEVAALMNDAVASAYVQVRGWSS